VNAKVSRREAANILGGYELVNIIEEWLSGKSSEWARVWSRARVSSSLVSVALHTRYMQIVADENFGIPLTPKWFTLRQRATELQKSVTAILDMEGEYDDAESPFAIPLLLLGAEKSHVDEWVKHDGGRALNMWLIGRGEDRIDSLVLNESDESLVSLRTNRG
jgi:hypothetical protein